MTGSRMKLAGVVGLALSAVVVALAANTAKGTATYKTSTKPVTVTFTHAYLMKGPDVVSGTTIRRLVLATRDLSAALKACQNMTCSSGDMMEGLTVDFDAGPRLNYWFVANGQKIQDSGTAAPTVATLTTDSPTRLAGTLNIDGTQAGGPKVQVEFDATLIKELTK